MSKHTVHPGAPLLELVKVTRNYQIGTHVLEVLKGIDFTLQKGEWCSLLGASGSGKTTLLHLVGALEKPTSGKVLFQGVDLASLSRREVARFRGEKLGFVFQAYHLLPELTLLENVMLAGRLNGMNSTMAKMRATSLIERVGLADRRFHRPAELSGGEQQRAAIARALMNDPELLLADEPTGNLDAPSGEAVYSLLQKLRAEQPGLTILMITHNAELARRTGRVVTLIGGLLQSEAAPEGENPNVNFPV